MSDDSVVVCHSHQNEEEGGGYESLILLNDGDDSGDGLPDKKATPGSDPEAWMKG